MTSVIDGDPSSSDFEAYSGGYVSMGGSTAASVSLWTLRGESGNPTGDSSHAFGTVAVYIRKKSTGEVLTNAMNWDCYSFSTD